MLTFEEKLSIIESFPELTRHNVSLGRVNFHYDDSIFEKKIVVYRLHPNGNGYVYAEKIENGDYDVDAKGMVNIREFSKGELREIITKSITSLSEIELEETWVNDENQKLKLVHDFDLWNIYAGDLLDGTYVSYNAAADYLQQEGFRRVPNEEE
ncbi:hypothetical protein [Oceanobacillus halophilus]|uniref:Uncharacterized protein n=1 Tax=Oceanobacillus halophilus TaxID=930130 RepID=A0A494ZW44_9BACI|nr:hypothetical protein [Oceanobacillus halophilus]RKQ30791.1 hypothetical protein D8M06_15345 [Oceanobacillus halophilus]